MSISAMLLGLICVMSGEPTGSLPGSMTINNCLVALDEEAEVPAQEPGVLMELPVKEGQQVKAGELLAKIDDNLSQMDLRVEKSQLEVAREEAENNVNVEYATAAAKVSEVNYLKNAEANKQVKGSVPEMEIERLKLEWKRSLLSIEQSKMDKRVAGLKFRVSQAELDAAAEKVERRQIKAPLDGQVRKLYHHVGEWVQPSDPVLHVVRVNRLRTEGLLKAPEFAPEEVSGRPVTIKVQLARGRVETFKGAVVFVDPMVQAGSEYLVRAAIQNREENGQWLLRAGM